MPFTDHLVHRSTSSGPVAVLIRIQPIFIGPLPRSQKWDIYNHLVTDHDHVISRFKKSIM